MIVDFGIRFVDSDFVLDGTRIVEFKSLVVNFANQLLRRARVLFIVGTVENSDRPISSLVHHA